MISCKLTTYGRVSYLEEALYSFINQQDIENSELIIVNDYPLQTLIYDHPNVKIFNLKETFRFIGDKDNFALEKGKGDIIATWDDDDLYMSNHLNNIRKYFVPRTTMLHWRGVLYNEPNSLQLVGIGNSGMIYSREAWLKVGKHPIMNAGGDSVFSQAVHKLGNTVEANVPNNEISAWYRWGSLQTSSDNGIFHQSGMGTDTEDKPNIIQRHSIHIELLRSQGKIPTGEIILKPRWKRDYSKMLKDYADSKRIGGKIPKRS